MQWMLMNCSLSFVNVMNQKKILRYLRQRTRKNLPIQMEYMLRMHDNNKNASNIIPFLICVCVCVCTLHWWHYNIYLCVWPCTRFLHLRGAVAYSMDCCIHLNTSVSKTSWIMRKSVIHPSTTMTLHTPLPTNTITHALTLLGDGWKLFYVYVYFYIPFFRHYCFFCFWRLFWPLLSIALQTILCLLCASAFVFILYKNVVG